MNAKSKKPQIFLKYGAHIKEYKKKKTHTSYYDMKLLRLMYFGTCLVKISVLDMEKKLEY
jgi:hypothetical protein